MAEVDVRRTAELRGCDGVTQIVGMTHPVHCRRQDSHGVYGHRALVRMAGGGTALIEWDDDDDDA